MNRCSASEEETNNFHVPPPGMTSADILSSGRITGKVRRTPKSSFQNSPKKPPNSIKKKQQSAKENSLKVGTNSCLVNGLDLQQQTKSGDIYPDTGQQKKIEKHRRDCYSDGGIKCQVYLSYCCDQRTLICYRELISLVFIQVMQRSPKQKVNGNLIMSSRALLRKASHEACKVGIMIG